MAFERQQRVARFWAWLPTFRAAAEFESLQRASLALGVSVSAVSRTIKQLEATIGEPLLERNRTGVTVTPAGARLLTQTRTAMRLVDDALEPGERISIAATSPDLAALAARWLPVDHLAGLRLVETREARRALQLGEIDMLLTDQPLGGELVDEQLGTVEFVKAAKIKAATALLDHAGLDTTTRLLLAERLGLALIVPRALAPARWRRAAVPPRPLFASFRRGPSRFGPLLAALRRALASSA